jgi:hypothetical protein
VLLVGHPKKNRSGPVSIVPTGRPGPGTGTVPGDVPVKNSYGVVAPPLIVVYYELFVYDESRKREIKIKPISECRCHERLKTKTEESTRLGYTGLLGELEHLKIKTRLIDRSFRV